MSADFPRPLNANPKTLNYDGCSKKFFSAFYTSVKINRQYLQFRLWLILNVQLATAAYRNNTFSRACAKSRQNGVVW